MSKFKTNLTHEQEEIIVSYCIAHDIDINQANAYSITMDAFKEQPILYKYEDPEYEDEKSINVTSMVARTVECQKRTIDRLADKIEYTKQMQEQAKIKENIKKAEEASIPNLEILVDNLHRLNIVDGDSYLALICFLMQLKYTRNRRLEEDDKTGVFFNGVARNGKSATAKAICEIEKQYGKIFKAQSGKLLEASHGEEIWKSHLNFFDEVKPTDINRELLLTIINGGTIELNPKNKKQYNYNVNTNNIFTSNDQISLKQRRVSIVKFGDRLNGRPLETGTLTKIITNIMNSLPDFSYYYDIYQKVSVNNENRENPLAMEGIITYLSSKLGEVNMEDKRSLNNSIIFTAHDIYSCIKGTYSKQIISSERKEAIRNALEDLKKQFLVDYIEYANCTTKNYQTTGKQYLKIIEKFNNINTKDEKNTKISKQDLTLLLSPYFETTQQNTNDIQTQEKKKITENPNIRYISSLRPNNNKGDLYDISYKLYFDLKSNLQKVQEEITEEINQGNSVDVKMAIISSIKKYITKEICEYIEMESIVKTFKDTFEEFTENDKMRIKNKYLQFMGLTDELISLSE